LDMGATQPTGFAGKEDTVSQKWLFWTNFDCILIAGEPV
jgi:hypothetical protein